MSSRKTGTAVVVLLTAICLFAGSVAAPRAHESSAAKDAPSSSNVITTVDAAIGQAELKAHVEYLASNELAGRGVGEPGIDEAEGYIATTFRSLGLKPLPGQDDFFVEVGFFRRSYEMARTKLEIDSGEGRLSGTAGKDFRPFDFSDDGGVEAEVVFAGYGITAPEHEHDDYEGLEVTGKLVLVLRHEPGEQDPDSSFDGTASTRHAAFVTKARNAQEHGAAGMLLVTDPLHHDAVEDLRLGGRLGLEPQEPEDRSAEEEEEKSFLAAHISHAMAETLVARSGRSLAELQTAIDGGTQASSLATLGVSASLSIQSGAESHQVPARNVAAFLEGRDPELKNEWILIGGHHDHLGGFHSDGDTIYNGADDNASGTSGVLELAEAFARREKRPRRSIVFATFTGEESGLLGSRAMVEQELIPIENIVFMFNLDMIGRNSNESVQVYGDGYARELRPIVETANADIGVPLDYAGTGYSGNSDHDPFYRSDIPFMFFFTGIHEDYHQLADHADKLDYGRMESILRLAYAVLDTLAEAPRAPGFIHHVNWLGVQVEVLADDDGVAKARITAVEEGSRAAESGLEANDVFIAFDEQSVSDPAAIGRHFRDIEPGTEVTLGVLRADGKVEVRVERAKVGYMGISPGPVDADRRKELGLAAGMGIVLRRVTPDGPSGKAGLEDDDVVLEIGGRPVGVNNLRTLLSQIGAGETVDLAVIRESERLTIPVTLGERPSR